MKNIILLATIAFSSIGFSLESQIDKIEKLTEKIQNIKIEKEYDYFSVLFPSFYGPTQKGNQSDLNTAKSIKSIYYSISLLMKEIIEEIHTKRTTSWKQVFGRLSPYLLRDRFGFFTYFTQFVLDNTLPGYTINDLHDDIHSIVTNPKSQMEVDDINTTFSVNLYRILYSLLPRIQQTNLLNTLKIHEILLIHVYTMETFFVRPSYPKLEPRHKPKYHKAKVEISLQFPSYQKINANRNRIHSSHDEIFFNRNKELYLLLISSLKKIEKKNIKGETFYRGTFCNSDKIKSLTKQSHILFKKMNLMSFSKSAKEALKFLDLKSCEFLYAITPQSFSDISLLSSLSDEEEVLIIPENYLKFVKVEEELDTPIFYFEEVDPISIKKTDEVYNLITGKNYP